MRCPISRLIIACLLFVQVRFNKIDPQIGEQRAGRQSDTIILVWSSDPYITDFLSPNNTPNITNHVKLDHIDSIPASACWLSPS